MFDLLRSRRRRPEGQFPALHPEVDPVRCLRCGACASVCPLNVIEVSDTLARIGEGCNNCGLCVRACPLGGIRP
jgi:ferredoxin